MPNDYTEVKKVVLLYDGKPASVFALKMLNYLMPWMKDVDTEVVSVVDPAVQTELPENVLIMEFIYCHYPQAKYILLYGNPEIEMSGYLKKLSDDTMVVLGAYQRGSVSRWLKPSMADLLMKTVKFPFFIAHNK